MPPKQPTAQSKKLGSLVRKARAAKGLSTRTLAGALRINFSTISYLEAGRVHRPAVQILRGLSRTLDIPLEPLYSLAGYNRPEGLPEFGDYLRSKYGFTDAEAAAIERPFRKLLERRDKAVTP